MEDWIINLAISILRSLLEKGRTEDWDLQLAEFLDSDGKMDAQAMLDYFKPLADFLATEIETNNIPVSRTL